jgi:hypothetical protein
MVRQTIRRAVQIVSIRLADPRLFQMTARDASSLGLA